VPEQHDQKDDHQYQAKAPTVVMVWRTSIEGIDLGQRERPSCPMSGMGRKRYAILSADAQTKF